MTPKERAAMQQVICKINQVTAFDETGDELLFEAQEILRKALAEQAEQKPVGMVIGGVFEPWNDDILSGVHELYTAPVRTKDLTDDEIEWLVVDTLETWNSKDTMKDFARAVIEKFKEKNK